MIQKILPKKITHSTSLKVFKEMLEELEDALGLIWGNTDNL